MSKLMPVRRRKPETSNYTTALATARREASSWHSQGQEHAGMATAAVQKAVNCLGEAAHQTQQTD